MRPKFFIPFLGAFLGLFFAVLFLSFFQRAQKEFCGGIANLRCSRKFTVCEIKEKFPDASGICVFVGDPIYLWGKIRAKIEKGL